MRKAFALVLPILALSLSGCIVQSLQPLYRAQDTILQPELVGRWKEQGGSDIWEISRVGDRAAYQFTLTESDGGRGVFEGHLVKLGQTLFLDLAPADLPGADKTPGYYSAHLVPVHSFYRVDQLTPSPTFKPLDYKWLKELLAKTPGALRHELIGDSSDQLVVLTASTLDLQAYLRAHATTDAAFGKPIVLEAIK